MAKITMELPPDLSRQMDRMVRDGWFADEDAVVTEALRQFVESKSYLGDSPRMLHRFAADALNESKPETALKFVNRALSLLSAQKVPDLTLYQSLIELRVQILMILNYESEALATVEEAQEKLPNSPTIRKWIERLRAKKK